MRALEQKERKTITSREYKNLRKVSFSSKVVSLYTKDEASLL
jgi:hypothetical protein